MRIAVALVAVFLSLHVQPALADNPKPSTITVTATGTIDFVPDVARIDLTVQENASSAAAAAKSVAAEEHSVIAALRKLGVAESDMQTYGFQIRRMPAPAQPMPMGRVNAAPMPPGQAGFPGESRMPIPGSTSYQVTETLQVTTSVEKAPTVVDAASGAGAVDAFGYYLVLSRSESLYRQALAKAVEAARARAESLAKAAHVTIVGIEGMTTESAMARQYFAQGLGPPVPHPDVTVSATIEVTYRIK